MEFEVTAKIGSNGIPKILKTLVYSARTNAIVPNAIIIGVMANHISNAFLNPEPITFPKFLFTICFS